MFDPDSRSTYYAPTTSGRATRPALGLADQMQAMIDRSAEDGRADSAAVQRLRLLIDAEAFADAALALAAYLLPGWAIRRIACDGADWHCTLSCQPNVPDWLDEAAEGCGPDLASALLDAIVQARKLPLATLSAHDAKPAPALLLTDNFW